MKSTPLWEAKEQLIDFGRRLWQRGYVASNDGNMSLRIGDDRLLATPTGVSKGFMTAEMLIVTDLDGHVVQGTHRPSSELKMHLEVYRLRDDIQAVVHAHPPVATAFSVAGLALDRCILPESVLTLGAIPIAPYGTPSTDEIPKSIRPFVPKCDAVLLANHGAVTWADSLTAAYHRMETLEHTATIIHHAVALGNINPLSATDVAKLRTVREQMGLSGKVLPCGVDGSCETQPAADSSLEQLIEQVTREVLKKA